MDLSRVALTDIILQINYIWQTYNKVTFSCDLIIVSIPNVQLFYIESKQILDASKDSNKRKTARIVNVPIPSEEDYPWLAGIIKIAESNSPGETVESYCTGALITKRYDELRYESLFL